jgi:hypothetical protein
MHIEVCPYSDQNLIGRELKQSLVWTSKIWKYRCGRMPCYVLFLELLMLGVVLSQGCYLSTCFPVVQHGLLPSLDASVDIIC